MEYTRNFAGIDDAVNVFMERYEIKSSAQEAILREYLSRTLSKTMNGLQQSGMTKQVKFWWPVDRYK